MITIGRENQSFTPHRYLVVYDDGRSPDNHLYYYRSSAERYSNTIPTTRVAEVILTEAVQS